ncbi:hypothetical protein CLNEO_04410 [Anaerotignum neopropionicum]|uniref:DUF3796 domain-containing protein n=1 Tax=Anaerotignum neopropionicum TaxID=36847 RepID=A0A136WIF9_9FIRM|nr:DUF3796 domain-containing protein [Anaerotignum neopropionicum]KXL54210.1 hypothetical protein CLNEO_03120 [Anaerotignum neopropionicum]KXL54335.1 hypothetical protein CLNEO_04410 [Anaerotignum neopropionicum]
MKLRCIMRGLMGLLSLLGFIGIYTGNKGFLAFFAFAVNFVYFFIKSDEMVEEYMNKAASLGFYCGMITTAIVTLICLFAGSQQGNAALLAGFASGWGVSVAVHGFSVGYYSFRESWVAGNDKE